MQLAQAVVKSIGLRRSERHVHEQAHGLPFHLLFEVPRRVEARQRLPMDVGLKIPDQGQELGLWQGFAALVHCQAFHLWIAERPIPLLVEPAGCLGLLETVLS